MKIMTQLLQNEDQTNKLINLKKKKKKKKKEEELLMKIRINQIDWSADEEFFNWKLKVFYDKCVF